ncbi:MAG: hypothetical protein Ta2E_00200 [Mycoplasmoidaceae bacterium]|nr:MAG: hypothetical protein Ta2E_00200 [Mycoplasmoidaceae bacterium]
MNKQIIHISQSFIISSSMGRFIDWLKGAWNTVKNVEDTIRCFIGKAAPMIENVGNVMSYLPDSRRRSVK